MENILEQQATAIRDLCSINKLETTEIEELKFDDDEKI
jgi:hypothetical protein